MEEAQAQLPSLEIKQCDLAQADQREILFEWATTSYPNLNILVNNPGIQRRVNLANGIAELLSGENEIDVNLVAPIHLSVYFAPFLAQQEESDSNSLV